ncbi:hypothetical protein [Pelotomaculum sp. FP]|nr:hypothetical protein [Pelotomaculum sp. FP]
MKAIAVAKGAKAKEMGLPISFCVQVALFPGVIIKDIHFNNSKAIF